MSDAAPRPISLDAHLAAAAIVEAHLRGDAEGARHLWPTDPSDTAALVELTQALISLAGTVAMSADDGHDQPRGTTLAGYRALLLLRTAGGPS